MAEEHKNPLADLESAFDRVAASTEEIVEEVVEQVAEETAEEVVEEVVESTTEESEEVVEETAAPESELENPEDTTQEEEASTEDVFEEESSIVDWDVEEGEADKPSEFDFKSLANEIGFDAKSKDEFVKQVNEIKAKAEAPDPTANLPENLKKAIEIASQDGDFLQYLQVTTVDYNAYQNLDLVKNDYANMLKNANGEVDTEQVERIMDSMTDAEIDRRGIELKQTLSNRQAQMAANLEAETARKREIANKELKSALDTFDEYRGFKYSPTHKKQMFDGITSGDMISQMFHGDDGTVDQKKVVKAYANHLYGEKQYEFSKKQAGTKAKKEVLNRISNKSIEPKGQMAKPTPKVDKNIQQKLQETADAGENPFKIVRK